MQFLSPSISSVTIFFMTASILLGIKLNVYHSNSFISISRFIFAGLRLNNAWASGTVLRPIPQPESPYFLTKFGLRLQVQASGFELTAPILEPATL